MINNQFSLKPFAALLPILLASCATFSPDGGFSNVEKITQNYIKQKPLWANTDKQKQAATEQVKVLLNQSLTVDDAVQLALLNNAQLQADVYALQIAEADLVQAGRLPNPSFSMLYTRNNGDYKIEQILTANIFALLTMPQAVKIEKKRFAAMQNVVSLQILSLAFETRKAYFYAVGAYENVSYLTKVKSSAKATAEFAKRMRMAGNFNKLDLAREQTYYSQAALDLAQAKNQQVQTNEALTQLLGVDNTTAFSLPERLPDLPKSSEALKNVNNDAFAKRLDLQQIKLNTQALAAQLGLTKSRVLSM